MSAESKAVPSGAEMLELAMQGFQLYEQGLYSEAKAIFTRLSELDPNQGYFHTALGAVYLAEEDLERAGQHLNRALALDRRDTSALVNRGEVFLRLGKLLEATKDFARVVALDPESKDPLTLRARMLAAAALETIEEAWQAEQAEQGDEASATE